MRRYPWTLRFRPDNREVSSTISDATEDMYAAQASMRQTLASHDGSLIDRIELESVWKATAQFTYHLWLESLLHPDQSNKAQTELLVTMRQMKGCTSSKTFNDSLLAQLRSLKLESTATYLECLELEVLRGTASTELQRAITALQKRCITLGDEPGCMYTLILLEDHLCTPPMTSPIVYGLITEGTCSGYEILMLDNPDFEDRHRIRRNNQVDRCCDQAFMLAQRKDNRRAMGMIRSRRAALLQLEAIANDAARTDGQAGH